MSLFGSLFGSTPSNRVDGATARQLVQDGAQLVDVRTPAEFRAGHIDGAANHPVDGLAATMSALDPHQPVVVYCRSGGRSARAAQLLQRGGFETVKDLGPISAW
jgi:phage shock protein E